MILFIGEKRSKRAITMGVHWKDGRLAAKQLFDALKACGIDPTQHVYVNVWEKPGVSIRMIRAHTGPRVGMGKKVCRFLTAAKIEHIQLTHPAARGAIRKKEVYAAHVKEILLTTCRGEP
jgi:hypothetical protein